MTTTDTESTDTIDPLEQARKAEADRQRIVYGNWRDLVRAIGDRKTVPLNRINEVLAGYGRTVSQLDEAVQTYRKRKAIADQIAAAEAARQKKPALVKALEVEVKKLRAAEAAFHKVADPIAWEIENIDQLMHDAKTAAQQLRQTFDDPFVLAEAQEIDRALRVLMQRKASIEDQINRVTTNNDLASTDSLARRMSTKQRTEEAKAGTHQLAELNADLASIKVREAALLERSNELAKLRLIP